ncbi:MAG: hypothetical protein L0387_36975, partial [Acidobacteria bacterium]|nr:hypothetical protein [Acidobacteriota bacterium]
VCCHGEHGLSFTLEGIIQIANRMVTRSQRGMQLANRCDSQPRAMKIGIVSEYPFTADGIESCLRETGRFDFARLQFSDLPDVDEKTFALLIIDLTGPQVRRDDSFQIVLHLAKHIKVVALLSERDLACLPKLIKGPIASCLLRNSAPEELRRHRKRPRRTTVPQSARQTTRQ